MSDTVASEIRDIRPIYEKALLRGSYDTVVELIDGALNKGVHPLAIYQGIIVPSQIVVGELWHEGELSISEEHRTTQITIELMNRIRQRMPRKSLLHKRVVVTSLDGEMHWIGARVVSDFFYQDGWDVEFLGGGTPVDDLLRYLSKSPTDLLAVSVTMESAVQSLRDLVREIRSLSNAPRLILGGKIFQQNKELSMEFHGCSIANDPADAVKLGRKLCEVDKGQPALEQILKSIGANIQQHRKTSGLSQKELADSSGLDRAYISSLEGGKQNVTIGALVKLAAALDISIFELIKQP